MARVADPPASLAFTPRRVLRALRDAGPGQTSEAIRTFSTWPEDAGIPARVIDELMAARVVEAIQQRLMVVLGVAEQAVARHANRSTLSVF